MATVSDAISALGINEWVLRGEPENAEDFASMFRKVTGSTDDGTAIESDNSTDWGVTWSQVETKQKELVTTYINNAYQRSRAEAYPPIADQLDDIYHNGVDEWKKTIKAVKDKYPKE